MRLLNVYRISLRFEQNSYQTLNPGMENLEYCPKCLWIHHILPNCLEPPSRNNYINSIRNGRCNRHPETVFVDFNLTSCWSWIHYWKLEKIFLLLEDSFGNCAFSTVLPYLQIYLKLADFSLWLQTKILDFRCRFLGQKSTKKQNVLKKFWKRILTFQKNCHTKMQ